ncbi:ABC transporter [Rhodobacter veldkampii DSM 11550]|uniref:ABC transporter n=1 Tax=Phaeovulum veldkampii DSM 11550 TaxID=1185920 RepID=A0A2T4JLH8_9RHOB|nr:ABC transporter substrate-binding protein [Phaeovulum veldkampii]MBK5947103.1 ABC transporter [Phaeovulum veldkampii DSM 11550]PTE18617.1 ABC transporter [Phaeovulum veldkampii DSM 11550]TDQ57239.1 phospholipid transport system substrate-binding protein [Phaeovulum veldkampii DSM 11550]
MPNNISRRGALALVAGGIVGAFSLPGAALALNDAEARALIDRALGDVNAAIASGKSQAQLFREFEAIFTRYSDVPVIARSALGVAARQASPAQMTAFTAAFKGYLSRKYGRRFREIVGGRFEVTGARQVKSFYEVSSIAYLKGEAPFKVEWHVSDKSGRNLFFNIIVEGVNMLAAERAEIGAMLDRRRGNIDALIADLKTAG